MAERLAPEQERTAIQSPDQLKLFLKKSGRQYIVLVTDDLIDSLPYPEGVQQFQECVEWYRHQRWTIPTGRTRTEKDDLDNECEVPIYKTDALEVEELDALIAWAQDQKQRQLG